MKRLLTLLFAVAITMASHADDEVTVTQGSAAILQKKTTATCVIDYSATKVGKQTLQQYLKNRGDDFVRDWPEDSKRAALYFTVRFNQKSKGMEIVDDDSDAKYKVVFKVKTMDVGNGAGAFIPFASASAGGCIVSGTVEIRNWKTGKVVCTFDVDEVKGTSSASETVRIGLAYHEVANKICRLGRKADPDTMIE